MLTSVSTPQSTSVYSYGPTGMREKAVVTQGGTTKTTESIWEGGRLAAERDSDGTLYRYTYAPDGTPLALTRGFGEGAVTYSYHTDAAGSVVAITDPSGAVVASYRYDAFGAVTSVAGSDPVATRNPLRYRAYYHDAATGLYYLPARYYDPATARFLSPDPAPPVAGDPLSLNRYIYCEGDPVNFTDPDGARHEAGSGVGAPVATEAIEYAKRGDMGAATAVQAAYRDGLRDGYAAGYDYDRAHALAERAAQEARSLDVLAGWLVGISAASAIVATAASSVALAAAASTTATVPAAATVAGAVIPASTAAVTAYATTVAAVAGATSLLTGAAYAIVTAQRVDSGYVDAADPRSNTAVTVAGLGSSALGAISTPFAPGLGLIGASCAWGDAVVEWTTY